MLLTIKIQKNALIVLALAFESPILITACFGCILARQRRDGTLVVHFRTMPTLLQELTGIVELD